MHLWNEARALPEPWRTWRDAGLEFILTESACPSDRSAPEPPQVSEQPAPSWPEPWRTQLRRMQRSKPVIWTYLELGCDLCGRPDPQRRELWSSIIEGLGWPKGSVVFWPCSTLLQEGLHPRPDLFWKGMPHLDPTLIVIFGEPAFNALLPQAQPAFGMIRTVDPPCLYLPGPGDMLPDNRRAKQVVWEYLKTIRI
jgi:hypothetical protein